MTSAAITDAIRAGFRDDSEPVTKDTSPTLADSIAATIRAEITPVRTALSAALDRIAVLEEQRR